MVVKKRAHATGGSRRTVPAVPAAEQAPEPPAASPRTAAKKTPARRTTAKKAAAKKAAAGKAAGEPKPAKKAAAKAAAADRAVTEKAAGKRAAGKVPPGRAGGEARAAHRAAAGGDEGKETAVGKVEADKTEVPSARTGVAPGALAVLPGEDPWTEEEVAGARAELADEVTRLRAEIESSEAAVAGLMRDSGDGAGDEADTGTKNITREYELALAANTRDTLTQARRALQRLDEGTYGQCEVCGRPIGKARMQAFPRATLCLDDKQKQERR
jgi:RNA polymerase-binding transcription factor